MGAIDDALSFLATELRKAKTTAEVSENRLKEAQTREEGLQWIVGASEDLQTVEETKQKDEELEELIESLEALLNEARRAEVRGKAARVAAKEGQLLLGQWEHMTAEQGRVTQLEALLGEIREAEEELCGLRESVTATENEFRKRLGKNCPLCGGPLTSLQCSALTCTSATDPP